MRLGGSVRSIQIANPAAGADWSAIVPAGKVWDVLCCFFTLTTGVTAANRAVGVAVQDAVPFVQGIWRAGVLQTASLVWNYSGFARATGAADPNGSAVCLMCACPSPRRVPSGWRFGSSIHGIQATDQVSAVSIVVEEYPL